MALLLMPLISVLVSYWPLLLLILSIFYFVIYGLYFHPLAGIPGPRLAALTRLRALGKAFDGKAHFNALELHEKYGPVVRVSPNSILVNSPEHMSQYFQWSKGDYWLAFRSHPTDIPHHGEFRIPEHIQKKKRVQGGYNLTNILKGEPQMDRHISAFMERMDQYADRGEQIELAHWLQWVAFEIAFQITFSESIGFIERGEDVNGLIAAVHSTFTGVTVLAHFPWVTRLIQKPWAWSYLAPKPHDKTSFGKLLGLTSDAVDRRMKLLASQGSQSIASNPQDILQWILEHEDKEGQRLSASLLKQETIATALAGSDSTSSAMRAAVLYIATTPRVYNKLMSQITTADAAGLLSSHVASWEEIQKHIPYIESIRKESLRLQPVAGAPLPREIPVGGATLASTSTTPAIFLPAGTEVAHSQWAVGRNPAIFGSTANLFIPERWTDPSLTPEEKKLRDAGDIVFGGGPMACTGRNIAYMEIHKVIVELFRRFEVQIVRPDRAWEVKVGVAFVHGEYWVSLKRREGEKGGEE